MDRKDFLKTMALWPITAGAMHLQQLAGITESFPKSDPMPVLFVGHGSPMNALEDNPFTRSLKTAGKTLTQHQKPNAILVVSAHWLTQGTFVCVNPKPETIHDFGGFPDALFQMQYPAPGAPEYARETAKLLPHSGETDEWGLDHGAWTILLHLFPDADIPVFQLSIDYYQPMEYHFNLAKQLQSLRKQGVLIIGSGNIVHNLRMSMQRFSTGDARPYDWAVEFDEWTRKKIETRDFEPLLQYEKMGSAGKLAVPTVDHYVPMLYSLALAGEKEPITQLYEEVSFGGISMRTFQIG